ncbi:MULTISPECIES: 3-oxoacyl-ACP synthase III family protein [unclassified Nocardiopsis]|uniref:3-oxoacyl-ACP synthase III family protein n=1 Tax=unclassified Nocardiopsis TaxID=2649073 RepID=UPI001359C38C|nr:MULTISPECIES: 3-oxoacyl-[acyl-carrier-protein] synthase III C-terminal domain-containing protein [unclassified Nocardiopsis]
MGIAGFTIEIPTSTRGVDEMSRQSGHSVEKLTRIIPAGRISVLADDQTSWSIGRDAAAKLLAQNPVPREDIGLVIYAGSSEWGTPFWSPAAKIALELGIHRAHCYELSNFCNAVTAALAVADAQVRAGTHRYALVVVADPLSRLVDYGTGYEELFNFADGAAAVLVSAEDARYEILASALRTDPVWVDYYYGEIHDGGVRVERTEKREGLGEAFTENFTELTRSVLAEAGTTADEVAYFLVTHGNQDLHRDYLAAMGAGADRSVFNYDVDGHLGGVDPLLALEGLEREGRLSAGDVVVVATAGSGFSWGVMAIRVT